MNTSKLHPQFQSEHILLAQGPSRLRQELQSAELFGDFTSYLSIYDKTLAPNLREQAGACRALAFVKHNSSAANLIAEVRQSPQFASDWNSRTIVTLAEAALFRYQNRWKAAYLRALRSLLLAQRSDEKSLIADAIFAMAFALVELNRKFLAVDLYQRARKHGAATPYRSQLAALNEAWVLWDLGRWKSVKELLNQVPAEFSPRLCLMLALVEVDQSSFEKLVPHILQVESKTEQRQLLTLILEVIIVHQSKLSSLGSMQTLGSLKTWAEKIAFEVDQNDGNSFWCSVLHAAWASIPVSNLKMPNDLDWRSKLERLFLVFLTYLKSDLGAAREIYRVQINQILVEHDLNTPLIPRWDELDSQTSAWGRLLHRSLRSESCLVHSDQFVLMNSSLKISGAQDFLIDLSGKSQSYRALQIILGPKGREISKRELHEQLTGNRYVSHLHDDRIQKLYKRLELKIFKVTSKRLWCWPGNNSLKLLETISYE